MEVLMTDSICEDSSNFPCGAWSSALMGKETLRNLTFVCVKVSSCPS